MKLKTLLLTLLLSTSLINTTYADFNDGYKAYIAKDYAAVHKEWKPLAEQGYSGAQSSLGVMYADGKGVLKDMTKAKYWTKKAYEGDDAKASEMAKENWDIFELWKY
jgi:TPR repeat protein